jgi:hypothetical protein
MKINAKMVAGTILLLTMSIGCKRDAPIDSICSECQDIKFVQEFQSVSAVVKKVAAEDYSYKKNQFYLLVDAETNFPALYKSEPSKKFIKLFSCEKFEFTNDDIDTSIKISGRLYNCLTGNHGQLTNDLHTFQIFN